MNIRAEIKNSIFILFHCSLANHLANICHDFKVKLATYAYIFSYTETEGAKQVHMSHYVSRENLDTNVHF